MKIGIMQPYLFPYLGYFQLINHVDQFVILDDVNFIKRGYINRNTICLNGKEYLFTLPVINGSQNSLINQLVYTSDKKVLYKLNQTIFQSYHNSSEFADLYPLVENVLNHHNREIHILVKYSIKRILEYLEIEKKIIFSSELSIDGKGEDRIINIIKKLNGKSYINPIGGRKIYSKAHFDEHNIQLSFIEPDPKVKLFQSQGCTNHLSIVDQLMLNPKPMIQELLNLKIIHNAE